MILESLNSIKENEYPLSIHVLMFIENEDHVILGRGHESDVRISDISVSRAHAKISFKDKRFYLEDSGSKFGTLVLAKDNVKLSENPTIIQIGRTLITAYNVKNDTKYKKVYEEDYKFNNLLIPCDCKLFFSFLVLDNQNDIFNNENFLVDKDIITFTEKTNFINNPFKSNHNDQDDEDDN
jgi:pSer/pThr/pTyr-binding forkhead associated (FHA) protein